jgi:hypothetical protein
MYLTTFWISQVSEAKNWSKKTVKKSDISVSWSKTIRQSVRYDCLLFTAQLFTEMAATLILLWL